MRFHPPRISVLIIGALIALLACPAGPLAATGALPAAGQLIVFVQPGLSRVERAFARRDLPRIRRVADETGVSMRVVNAAAGAPAEVAITPLIVFQNYRGRSIYQGRTTTVGRIRNFIRTSRYIPQGKAPNRRRDIFLWRMGRTRIWSPIKISSVTGTPPAGYRDAVFKARALESIAAGLKHYRRYAKAELGRADRGFYMDFYPWRAKDGTLFLSLALYSQFDCRTPVFEMKQHPLTGPWRERDALFQKAATLLQRAVSSRIQNPLGGDGFDALDIHVPTVGWERLGLALPPAAPQERARVVVPAEFPLHWVMAPPAPDEPPLVQFRFPAPLDQYAGEVKRISGNLALGAKGLLSGLKGSMRADMHSVTMGNAILDEALGGSQILDSRKYAEAAFVLDRVEAAAQPLAFGRLLPARLHGILSLKGRHVPVSAAAQLEPILTEAGAPRLLMRGGFQIDLRDFHIEEADGPEPARHTLLLDFNFIFTPRNS